MPLISIMPSILRWCCSSGLAAAPIVTGRRAEGLSTAERPVVTLLLSGLSELLEPVTPPVPRARQVRHAHQLRWPVTSVLVYRESKKGRSDVLAGRRDERVYQLR